MHADRLIDVHYATAADGLRIAFQAIGDDDVDLLYVPGYLSNLELAWEDPGYSRLLDRLSGFSRLIAMDKRGTGLSDRRVGPQTIEDHVGDIGAVLDGAGSTRAALLGCQEAGGACLLYAAANPDRVSAVITYSSRARCMHAPDYPFGWPADLVEGWISAIQRDWGRAHYDEVDPAAGAWSPSRSGDRLRVLELGRFFRLSASVDDTTALLEMYTALDIRGVLGSVRVPVLVLNREGDVLNPVEHANYLAECLPRGSAQILPGDEVLVWWGDVDAVASEVRQFVTGSAEPPDPDRVLATVFFTDFVGSTEQNLALGDRRWREVLDRHDQLVLEAVTRYSGRVIKGTGDGVLAIFDGPAKAVRCGDQIRKTLPSLGIQVRTGIHTAEIEIRGNDVTGVAVTLANRIMSRAGPSEILVSRTVKDLVAGSGMTFRDRGTHRLKGIPDEWQVFEFTGG